MSSSKNSRITLSLVAFILAVLSPLLLTFTAYAESATGAVNTYFSLSNATRLSVNMKPNYGEDGYHFYSLSPFFQGKSYGMYTGIQTSGNLGDGVDVGNLFIFSVWNATAAYPENGATATPFGGEGKGYSLRKTYDWQVGQTYTVALKREAFDSSKKAYRWSATITHKENGARLKIGEILAPAGANALATGAVFHERYGGNSPSCSSKGSNLEKASVTFSNLSSDKSVGFYGKPLPNDIFTSSACKPYIHTFSNSSTVVTGFGITSSEFNALLPTYKPAPQPVAKSAPKPIAKKSTPQPTQSSPKPTPATSTSQQTAPQDTKKSNDKKVLAIGAPLLLAATLGSMVAYKKGLLAVPLSKLRNVLSKAKSWLRHTFRL